MGSPERLCLGHTASPHVIFSHRTTVGSPCDIAKVAADTPGYVDVLVFVPPIVHLWIVCRLLRKSRSRQRQKRFYSASCSIQFAVKNKYHPRENPGTNCDHVPSRSALNAAKMDTFEGLLEFHLFWWLARARSIAAVRQAGVAIYFYSAKNSALCSLWNRPDVSTWEHNTNRNKWRSTIWWLAAHICRSWCCLLWVLHVAYCRGCVAHTLKVNQSDIEQQNTEKKLKGLTLFLFHCVCVCVLTICCLFILPGMPERAIYAFHTQLWCGLCASC